MHDQDRRSAAPTSARAPGFLTRLRRNTRGNTLAMVAAAMIPLAAMIGSGVDMSRAYMAKTRLQSACDAAALAGRRVMNDDTISAAVTTEVNRFFNYNFPQRLYGTNAFTPTVTRPAAGTVRIVASTRIPTTIMSMFGFTSLPLNVNCDASLNFVNTDVMLVLDVTGSMDDDINGNSTSVEANRKITALRDAVMALYDQLAPIQTQLEANGLRLRYGAVPYSTTVNVGALIREVNPAYLSDLTSYPTRIGDYDDYQTNRVTDQNSDTQTYGSSISSTECDKYGVNAGYPTLNGQPAPTGGPAPAPVTTVTYARRDWGETGDTSGTNRTCRRRRTTTVTQTGYFASRWFWEQRDVDTSQFKMGTPVLIGTRNSNDESENAENGASSTQGEFNPVQVGQHVVGALSTSVTWNGCIVERDTVNTITSTSGYTIPSGAHDLDINLIPNSNATRWRPQWPAVYFPTNSNSSLGGVACPTASRRLRAWTRADLLTYVNTLDPGGNTYHDTGMIWGARMISRAGIFADSPDTFASMPVARHIIFMSDGQMVTSRDTYSLYGVERYEKRVSGQSNPGDLTARHNQRFRMICNAAKANGASIWVIAFGTTLSAEMTDCASNANQASTSGSRDQLIARFREIGSNIGALRLTQ
jgi:Flp pilus assembly protein TadG